MIICVPSGHLGLKSEAPETIYFVHFVELFTPVVRQLIEERTVGMQFARGPPLENTQSHKERTTRSLLLVA
jgi:hypothetical protein